jgi:hypothetical protein
VVGSRQHGHELTGSGATKLVSYDILEKVSPNEVVHMQVS